ncbi:MAG: hypothetical protein LBB87_03255 [Nitrososphaerota archaeon]|jgi:hypothetical protein|nr:hypothetical protein [Nitrososphaerota archaeon]
MYDTARAIVRQTSKDVTQPTHNEHLDTCIGDYVCNSRFIKQGGIKQFLKQNPLKKLKLVPHPAKIDTNLTTNTQTRRSANE